VRVNLTYDMVIDSLCIAVMVLCAIGLWMDG
jgi:hypothetical protein